MSNLEQAEEAKTPVQIITERLARGDEEGVAIWRFCVNEWLGNELGDVVSPEDYYQPVVEPELEEDPDDLDDDEVEDGVEPEIPDLDPETSEQLLLERPYLEALTTFWIEMDVFKRVAENLSPEWGNVVEASTKLIGHIPSDTDKLVTHVERINRARLAAEEAINNQAATAVQLQNVIKERF